VWPRQYRRRGIGRRAVTPRRTRRLVTAVGRSRRRLPFEVRVLWWWLVVSLRTRVEDDTSGRLCPRRAPLRAKRGGRGGQAAWLLGPVGCGGRPPCTPGLSTWSSSRSLRCLMAPGNLVSEGASRLDAFSAYPVPTWLPGGAPSGTAGTPEVGPPQSSRTRGDAPQVSYTHGR
jgi:hypothetical protein